MRLKILYIFAKEYQTLLTKPHNSEDDDDDEEEDEGEEEDEVSEGGEEDFGMEGGMGLDDLLDLTEEDDEEWEDPSDKLDPLYKVPLGAVVEGWVKEVVSGGQFNTLAQQLPQELQVVLRGILQKNSQVK